MTAIPAFPDATGPRRRLLLAEDDPDLTEMLTELLTAEGNEVDVARDGQAALYRAMNGRYEIAVLDRGRHTSTGSPSSGG
jgi:DNA-binding response OmpR family regulator